MKVLIADDDKISRKVLHQLLAAEGYEVLEALDGLQALEIFRRQTVPIIGIIDWLMPGLEGGEVCRQVRKMCAAYPHHLILLTVRDSQTDVVAGLQTGANDYVTKPFDPLELLARVKIGIQMVNLQKAVSDRVRQLEVANRELATFSRSVSHDLRSPLSAVEGLVELLLSNCDGVLDETNMQFLHDIQNSATRMRGTIEDLLALSQSAHTELQRTTVDLSGLVTVICKQLRISQTEVDFELECGDKIQALADEGLCRIILENLLRNACKFSSKREQPKVQFGVLENGNLPIYFVRDNGAGFDMGKANRLFSPFQRLHSQDEFPGTGIGLTIVKQAIDRHGGRVWAEAEPDRGATFYFTLRH